ncbi:uncharacterized protein CPUR_02975 [Claviceps purpurea 20.1]|uniref:SET domain-containing protein n=1 Tax=Claviceps purpurea (strain 20.1) TaxID=1111077 RepID=M1VVC5_CLAP2|nr:uncharacterized protein CPUR_02975 [Claviceps purpurea 20.1]
MENPANNSLYALQEVAGKGKGLIAIKTIPKGTQILSEPPLIKLPVAVALEHQRSSICHQLEALSDDQRDGFLSLSNIHPFNDAEEQYLGIFLTNALPVTDAQGTATISLEACRINHDCDNNALTNLNSEITQVMVHAIRDIDIGEEITISYVLCLLPRERRQKALKLSFEFTCLCRLCSLPDEQSQERDRKLEQIVSLEKLCVENFHIFPLQTLRFFEAQACLYCEIGREDRNLAHVFESAAALAIAYGDLARGRIFMQKARSTWTTIFGSGNESDALYGAFARDPSLHPRYGFSMEWKTALKEIPKGLEPDDFEDWLWKRGKPENLAKPKNPPRRRLFSGFADLAQRSGIDACGPAKERRACFLGEIVNVKFRDPLDLEIKDIHNQKITLHFYTQDRGREFRFQVGHTVAVLNATQYIFKFGPPGIRHEDPRMIKECQKTGWTTHKVDCKFLKDPDLRGLFHIKWDDVQDCVRFPLAVANGSY